MFLFTFVLLFPLVLTQQKKTVTVGVAAVENVMQPFIGYSLSGGAIGIALDRMRLEGIATGFDFKTMKKLAYCEHSYGTSNIHVMDSFRFLVNFTECTADNAVGLAVDFMKKHSVDAVIAPPCPIPAEIMGHLSTFYKKTLLGWGFLTDSKFSNSDLFPYITKVVPDTLGMVNCVLQLFSTFNWDRVAVFYTSNEVQYCESIADDATIALNDNSLYYVDVVQKTMVPSNNDAYLTKQLLRAKQTVRIILMCMDTAKDTRKFMRIASELQMVSDEFVYVSFGALGLGFGKILLFRAG
ncbi:hypothetical protein DICVIV_01593 [Dictyocaulus viviparus]|uniref:Receptor ligand binding region domain-containing protein n=1 Tax=Dictyocaulus viviparus TaxID=29172 RepID=A0A0D8Y6C1_DICVI|nr:hypothetical protein DICVIV_01593 [Dictyocaulus viviparus]